ncbi:MAG TPA: competence protein CoiA family protein [Smithellaceae bacterium]|nr:competence protein CoiA family protein [Smithellaceae bacterium]
MPLVALEGGTKKIFAWDVKERAPLYTCKGCGGRLVFMDCRKKIKYFRHYEHCDCDSEPETPEHAWGKEMVYKSILEIQNNLGIVELEYAIDKLRADVYWERKWQKVAIEIQATNYTIGIFEDKISNYNKMGFEIIYLFVGNNFLKQTKPYVYSLKEIEKQLFVNNEIPGRIYAGYLLPTGNVFIPSFQAKYASGGGECSHRFISMRGFEKTVSLKEFLNNAVCVNVQKSQCNHSRTKHVAHFEKIKRYKVVCENCNKFIKWLPNAEALKLGYSLD